MHIYKEFFLGYDLGQMVSKRKISEAVDRLRRKVRPVRIILFGSYARGEAGPGSDLDLLIVEKSVRDTHREMVRLQDLLRPLRLNADLLVVSEKSFRDWSDTPGSVIYQAAREGKVIYEMERAGRKAG